MKSAPAFQIYPRDVLADTHNLTDAEFGLYMRLLFAQWLHGSLPSALEADDGEAMVDLLPIGDIKQRRRAFKAISKHFVPHPTEPGRVGQARLERTRAEQAAHRVQKVEAGSRGGKQTQSRRRANVERTPSTASNPLEAESSPASASATADTPNGVATEKPPRPLTEPYGLAFWLWGEAHQRSLIPAHKVAHRDKAVRADLAAARDLLEAHPLGDITARAARLLDGIAAGRNASPTVRGLHDAWNWPWVAAGSRSATPAAEPPRMPAYNPEELR